MMDAINERLNALIAEQNVLHNQLYQAARYSLLSPGKRIRPHLTLATGEMLGAQRETLLTPACALELIHTYSLIHDDLPAMDNDDFRRGKPSLHKAYNEATAILTGDYLLTYAFDVLAKAPNLSPETRLQLIQTLANASGGDGMVGGQLLDISHKTDHREEINAKKTGALFKASVEFGAIIANAPPTTFKTLSLFGEKIGALFQQCDDILDGDQSENALHKAHTNYHDILKILDTLPTNTSLLKELTKKVIDQI